MNSVGLKEMRRCDEGQEVAHLIAAQLSNLTIEVRDEARQIRVKPIRIASGQGWDHNDPDKRVALCILMQKLDVIVKLNLAGIKNTVRCGIASVTDEVGEN